MKRRAFLLSTGFGTLGGAQSQATAGGGRVAVLTVSSEAAFATSLQALRDGLRGQGHVEGRDLAIDVRHAAGRAQDLPPLAVPRVTAGVWRKRRPAGRWPRDVAQCARSGDQQTPCTSPVQSP